MSVANEIYRTLGGHRFVVMTGAKNFIDLENGIRMKIGLNIALNLMKWNGAKIGKMKIVKIVLKTFKEKIL